MSLNAGDDDDDFTGRGEDGTAGETNAVDSDDVMKRMMIEAVLMIR